MADAGDTRHDDEIRRLLQEAEQQMGAGQLTKPLGDNAYETYRQVLRLDPNNTVAKAGVARIVSHYEKQAQQRKEEPETKVMQAIPHTAAPPPAASARQEPAKGGSQRWRIALYASMVLVFVGVGVYLFWRFAG